MPSEEELYRREYEKMADVSKLAESPRVTVDSATTKFDRERIKESLEGLRAETHPQLGGSEWSGVGEAWGCDKEGGTREHAMTRLRGMIKRKEDHLLALKHMLDLLGSFENPEQFHPFEELVYRLTFSREMNRE